MARYLTMAAAQLGPISRGDSKASVVQRLIALIRQAHERAVEFVVFPEMALTTFFPRWYIDDRDAVDAYFDSTMPSPETLPLFEEAARRRVGFYLGYCERAEEGNRIRRFNSSVLVDRDGKLLGKYRKVHVPGASENDPTLPLQHLEKLYFEDGNLGFPVFKTASATIGMAICNDRRWPETYRTMALKGAEVVVLGYNSPAQMPDWPDQNALRAFHHLVCMQSAAYQNGLWIVASAKAGREDGFDLLGHSCIIAPSGEVVALSSTLADELVPYRCDIDLAPYYKSFHDFERNRRPDQYEGLLAARGNQRSRADAEACRRYWDGGEPA
ncbi:MAG: N-carbamoyl-D-amino-acid hydrolase [Alphaproteobacteria bacterium]|nr:N-carbamoyl-D-amino-acid hydrolase [Alphaproteobacteria bacterium]